MKYYLIAIALFWLVEAKAASIIMVVSSQPDNVVMTFFSYPSMRACRRHRGDMVTLAEILDRGVWFTCTPLENFSWPQVKLN